MLDSLNMSKAVHLECHRAYWQMLKLASSITVHCLFPTPSLFTCVSVSWQSRQSLQPVWECVYVPAVLLTFHFSKCMVLIMNARSPQAGEVLVTLITLCVYVCVILWGQLKNCRSQMHFRKSKDKRLRMYLRVCSKRFDLENRDCCFGRCEGHSLI